MNEITGEFFQLIQGSALQLSPSGSYRQYSRFQWELRTSPEFAQAIAFWKKRLNGIDPVLDLGSQRLMGGLSSEEGEVCLRQVEPDLLRLIRARASALGVTLYAYLLAGAALASARASGQRKFILGCATSGRDSSGADALVGFCVNTLPLVVDVQPETSAYVFSRTSGWRLSRC